VHQVDHELRGTAHKPGGAKRAAAGDQWQDLAGVQDALSMHSDSVQGHRHESVVLHFVFREVVQILDVIERVVLARSVVLPELDLGSERRGFSRHAVFHPPGREENDVGEFLVDLEVGLEPELGVEVVIHVIQAEVTGDPGAVDDQGHRDPVQLLQAGGFFENGPLFGSHDAVLVEVVVWLMVGINVC
jgi:hypothetical protein